MVEMMCQCMRVTGYWFTNVPFERAGSLLRAGMMVGAKSTLLEW